MYFTNNLFIKVIFFLIWWWVSPHSVEANVQDYDIILSEFEVQLYSHVHFQTNTLEERMNPLIYPSTVLNSTCTVLKEWLWD